MKLVKDVQSLIIFHTTDAFMYRLRLWSVEPWSLKHTWIKAFYINTSVSNKPWALSFKGIKDQQQAVLSSRLSFDTRLYFYTSSIIVDADYYKTVMMLEIQKQS